MTVEELISHINNTIGYQVPVPETLTVDSDTYANVCWFIATQQIKYTENRELRIIYPLIAFGKHGGIFFKNIELLLEGKEIQE